MCCYTRHLTEEMRAAGLTDDRAGRREADRRIRIALGAEDDGCPDVWRRLKELGRDAWPSRLREPEQHVPAVTERGRGHPAPLTSRRLPATLG